MRGGGARILVVDADPVVRAVVHEVLGQVGYLCSGSTSVAEARSRLVADENIDVVLIDLGTEPEPGLGFLGWVSERLAAVYLIAMLDPKNEDSALDAVNAGAHDWVMKPLRGADLRVSVANVAARADKENSPRPNGVGQLEIDVPTALERGSLADELTQARVALQDQQNRLRALLDRVPIGVFFADENGYCDYVNTAAGEMSGYPSEQLLGRGYLKIVPAQDVERVVDALKETAEYGAPVSVQHRITRSDGSTAHVATRLCPVAADTSGASGYLGISEDVTERANAERLVRYQATHDDLTGLANRHLFTDHVKRHLANSQLPDLAVMLIDLDDFKTVNDVHGHASGDALLVETARRLNTAFSDRSSIVARLGGDEFVIATELEPSGGEASAAERALAAIQQPVHLDGRTLHVAASIGAVAAFPGSDVQELIRRADIAMYQAKDQGGQRCRVFDDNLSQAILDRAELQEDVRQAVAHQDIDAYYQPKIDCISGELRGLEILARWKHPVRGFVAPPIFIRTAQDLGLDQQLSDHILRTACTQAMSWVQDGVSVRPVPLAMNITASELGTDRLYDRLLDISATTGYPLDLLTIEITEESLIDDPDLTALRLSALRELGSKIALDDFGTGYSSLEYLSRLPIDELKIDKSFIDRIGNRNHLTAYGDKTPTSQPKPDQLLVQAILDLASILGLTVVAEGIEEPQQLEVLQVMGCATAQGYLIARPAPAHDPALEHLITDGRFDLQAVATAPTTAPKPSLA